jgi:hypothetical protein
MGEKLRDIHKIRIGHSELMVELNAGSSEPGGRIIHIQNDKFRYQLTEKDFYHFAGMILRSWSEFKFIKENWPDNIKPKNLKAREPVLPQTLGILNDFALQMETFKVNFRILDVQNKMITILLRHDDMPVLSKILKGRKIKQCIHPLGKKNGYKFLYRMNEFQLYKFNDLYLEFFFQLPCASLTPKTWMPLDLAIQTRLWEQEIRKDGLLWVDDLNQYLFHLCWAIFANNGFSPFEKDFLISHKTVLDDLEFEQFASLVFFKFTPDLLRLLKEDRYDDILPSYYKFSDY